MNRKNLIIAIIVFLVLVIPTLVIGLSLYQETNTNLTSQVFVERETVAGLAASAIKVELDKLTSIAQAYATTPGVAQDIGTGNWNGAKSIIVGLQNDPDDYDYRIGRFVLLDTKGTIETSFPGITAAGIGTIDDGASEWLAPLAQDAVPSFVSNVLKRSFAPQTSFIEVVVPIKENANIIGFAEITVPTNEFADFGKDVDINDDGFVYIVDRLGHVVSHPKYSSDGPIIDYSSLAIVQNVINGQSGTAIAYNPFEREDRAVAYEPVPDYNWGVVSQEPVFEAFASRDSILADIADMIGALSLIEFVIALLILTMSKPNQSK